MEKRTNTIARPNYSFKGAYALLSKEDKRQIQENIIVSLGISRRTFEGKRRGDITITAVEADIIREAFAGYGILKAFDHEQVVRL